MLLLFFVLVPVLLFSFQTDVDGDEPIVMKMNVNVIAMKMVIESKGDDNENNIMMVSFKSYIYNDFVINYGT